LKSQIDYNIIDNLDLYCLKWISEFFLKSDDPKFDPTQNKTSQKRTPPGPARLEITRNPRLSDIRWSKTRANPNPNDPKLEMTWAIKNPKSTRKKTWQCSTQNPTRPGSDWSEPDPWPNNFFDQTYMIRPVRTRTRPDRPIATSNSCWACDRSHPPLSISRNYAESFIIHWTLLQSNKWFYLSS
jgi:hypothetical protein